jgi:protein-disulfide isomerase
MEYSAGGKGSPLGWLWRRRRGVFDLLVAIAMGVAAISVIYHMWAAPPQSASAAPPAAGSAAPVNQPAVPLPVDPVSLEGAALRGSRSARVVMIEFQDVQCPSCGRFAREMWPTVLHDYVETGKVLVAFRHFPLEPLHPNAAGAAAAAACAGRQAKFWEMQDRLFKAPSELDPEHVREYARSLGLAMAPFNTCLAREGAARVEQDVREARRLGISSTPTFLFGTMQADGRVKVVSRLAGTLPLRAYATTFDRLLTASLTSGTSRSGQ